MKEDDYEENKNADKYIKIKTPLLNTSACLFLHQGTRGIHFSFSFFIHFRMITGACDMKREANRFFFLQ
jgi:hypothetical protein